MTPAELRALLAKATPGPYGFFGGELLISKSTDENVASIEPKDDMLKKHANGLLLEAAVNALPVLLDVVERVAKGDAVNSFGDCWYCGAHGVCKDSLSEHAKDCTWVLARSLGSK